MAHFGGHPCGRLSTTSASRLAPGSTQPSCSAARASTVTAQGAPAPHYGRGHPRRSGRRRRRIPGGDGLLPRQPSRRCSSAEPTRKRFGLRVKGRGPAVPEQTGPGPRPEPGNAGSRMWIRARGPLRSSYHHGWARRPASTAPVMAHIRRHGFRTVVALMDVVRSPGIRRKGRPTVTLPLPWQGHRRWARPGAH